MRVGGNGGDDDDVEEENPDGDGDGFWWRATSAAWSLAAGEREKVYE